MNEPKVESLGRKPCRHCGSGNGEVKRITTTVPNTQPVVLGYCDNCGGSLA